jgi:hypothetical protein
MSFEGHNNTALTGSGVVFSAVPSFDATPICSGDGFTGSRFNASAPVINEELESRISEVTVATGAVGNVLPGDILTITESTNPDHAASVHVGTHLVRHAVEPTPTFPYRKTSPVTTAGDGVGWCPVRFPTVVGYNSSTNVLTLSDLAEVKQGNNVGGIESGFHAPTGLTHVFIIRNVRDLASSQPDVFAKALVSARYTAINTNADRQGLFTVASWHDALGNVITEAEFASLVQPGLQASGMAYLPVVVGGAEYGLPDNNTVGYTLAGLAGADMGFRHLTFGPVVPGGTAISFNANGVVSIPPADGVIGTDLLIAASTPVMSHEFEPDKTTAVYHRVVDTLDIFSIPIAVWQKLNVPPASAGGFGSARCLLPSTLLALYGPNGAGTREDGFYAQGGIFLEPSIPRSALDLAANRARVVDATYSLPDPSFLVDRERENGTRDGNYYSADGTVISSAEAVRFNVRRIRRFHAADTGLRNLAPLRFAYEIRRGRISTYQASAKQAGVVTASSFIMDWETTKPPGAPKAGDVWDDGGTYTGTNLGPFDDPDVNIHPGDLFRLLDENGDLVDEAEVTKVSYSTLKLAAPGLTKIPTASLPGMRFEVWLRQAPVPHEQTNEQLLGIVTDKVVFTSNPTWGAVSEKGGYVPEIAIGDTYEDTCNQLFDDLMASGGTATFTALGVRKTDIVIVDPMGTIPRKGGLPAAQERGIRPLGDDAVPVRSFPAYVAGRPNPLDDNRGFYRVTKVEADKLTLNPVTAFTGAGGSPVTFAPTDPDRAYAVYPTIHASLLGTGAVEGQMDLRPTKARSVSGTFKTTSAGYSIRPFAYKVVRPSKLFEDETIDLVLSTRERMLTLIEMLRRATLAKSGTYFIFQRDTHIADLGSITDPELGLGLMTNAYLTALAGKVDVMPYANGSGCISLLDRRFWIRDRSLDSLTYDPTTGLGMKLVGLGDTAYTEYETNVGGVVRPVLPDLVDQVLEDTDRLRPLRYVWLAYRTNRLYGTLASLARYDAELAERLADQKRMLDRLFPVERVLALGLG